MMSRQTIEQMGHMGANRSNPARILNSFDLWVNEKDKSLCQHLMRDGFWESWTTAWMTGVIKPGMFCIDVGANYGYVTGVMRELAGAEGLVWAFEPAKDASFSLRDSIILNSWDNVFCFQVGLGDTNEVLTLNYSDEYAGGASFVIETPYGIDENLVIDHYKVAVVPLDGIVMPHKVDFVKIDVEGFEPNVLRGMANIIERDKPIITVEILPPALEQHHPGWLRTLCDEWDLYSIDTEGSEVLVSYEQLFTENWWMVVLRKKDR